MNKKKKIAYFGIDLLFDCLPFLYQEDLEIAVIFTVKSTAGDPTDRIIAFAEEHNIKCKTSPVTGEDICELEMMGVDFSVTAGYPYRIPVSKSIRQMNIHPAYLPIGRGPWPMPINILKGIPSGVTIHKIAEGFDSGDILLQREIPLAEGENLESLMGKIMKTSLVLLKEVLSDFDHIWQNAKPQGKGEYWPEPSDAMRTLSPATTMKEADVIQRAFYGYGVLYEQEGKLIEIKNAELLPSAKEGASLVLPLFDGFLCL